MKTAIITLSMNELHETTIPFIESLYKYTDSSKFTLFVVDNHSTDCTKEYLEEQLKKRSNIRLQLNPSNVGYSKGNNQALKQVSEDYDLIGLFNNDIMFTPGWLEAMESHFHTISNLGLISPRINKVRSSMSPSNYLWKYKNYLKRYKDSFTNNLTPYFCCVMMHRTVFEKVGFLDEDFSPAFFEDDDYSFRALYNGFINGYANNAFCFHNHCKTSSKLSNRKDLIDRNRALFYSKHYLGKYIYEKNAKKQLKFGKLIRAIRSLCSPWS